MMIRISFLRLEPTLVTSLKCACGTGKNTGTVRSIEDLPLDAIRRISLALRGGRRIPGTNLFAAVCKTWRDATPIEEEDEQLQLYLDQEELTEAQRSLAERWLLLHGQHVAGLQLPATTRSFVQTVLASPGFGSNLQRLDIRGTNTLVGLLAAKVQLPHLQHLTACLSQRHAWKVKPGVVLLKKGQQPADGLQPLQKACPGLTQLCLRIEYWETPPAGQPRSIDALLPRLLPPTLQQLRLGCDPEGDNGTITPELALGHLTALQHLELRNFDVEEAASLMELPAQCSVHLVTCLCFDEPMPNSWLPVAGKLVGLTVYYVADDGSVAVVPQLTRLTSLWLDVGEWDMEATSPLLSSQPCSSCGCLVGAMSSWRRPPACCRVRPTHVAYATCSW
jgi:hypothetical protein